MKVATDNVRQILLLLGALLLLSVAAQAQFARLAKDINTSPSSSSLAAFVEVAGVVFFIADNPATGAELWKSDGTAAGTVLVKDINARPSSSSLSTFANVNGILFFSAFDPATGYELWKSDGTEVGTVLVKDIRPGPDSSDPWNLTNVNGTLFFT